MNLLLGEIRATGDGISVEVDGRPVVRVAGAMAERLLHNARSGDCKIQLGVRPHHVELGPPGEQGVPGRVRTREFLGQKVLLAIEAGERRVRVVGNRNDLSYFEGEGVTFRFSPERVHFFSTTTGEAIRRNDL